MSSSNGTGSSNPKWNFDLASDSREVLLQSLHVLSAFQTASITARSMADAFACPGCPGGVVVLSHNLPIGEQEIESFKQGEFDERLIALIGHEDEEIGALAATVLVNKEGGYRLMVERLLGESLQPFGAVEENSLATTLVAMLTGTFDGEVNEADRLRRLLLSGIGECADAVYRALRNKLRPGDTKSETREAVGAN